MIGIVDRRSGSQQAIQVRPVFFDRNVEYGYRVTNGSINAFK